MIWWFRQLLLLRNVLQAKSSPAQLAMGVACGLLLGLTPKNNLLAPMLGVLLLALRMDLGVYALTALLTTGVAPWLDPLTHRLGLAVLTQPQLTPLWQWIFNRPVVPWMALNNTVVMGGLMLGGGLFYPVYRFSRHGFARYRRWRSNRLAATSGAAADGNSTAEHDTPDSELVPLAAGETHASPVAASSVPLSEATASPASLDRPVRRTVPQRKCA